MVKIKNGMNLKKLEEYGFEFVEESEKNPELYEYKNKTGLRLFNSFLLEQKDMWFGFK